VESQTLSFIREHIRSVWALEQLLLMRRHPDRLWTIDELVKELRGSAALVETNLAVFERAGVVAREADGRARFAPAVPVLGALCDEIEALYRERPVAMINAIASRSALKDLADAFKIRKDTSK
jgi:hypothetical protein